ncbi:hypothetical protein JTE90_021870 [Oedothorax gibbosus]|uniref:Uncharacterized protein n=1 Tax=Oedothorax gibbosus TaxID=931172 RepID=A0AAV6UYQ9_9ARAC|nr:hypothetical protein JTE90_021870 [Oedothorax gibbosus]
MSSENLITSSLITKDADVSTNKEKDDINPSTNENHAICFFFLHIKKLYYEISFITKLSSTSQNRCICSGFGKAMDLWKMLFHPTIFLSIVVYCVHGQAPPCPPSENVYPCFCDSDGLLTSVSCTGFRGLDKLLPVLKNTQNHNVSFGFWKSNLDVIPSDFFSGHKSVNLHFENCKISSFGSRPFSGLEDSLKSIYIYGSVDKRIKDLTAFPLGHLNKLVDLAFQANDIKKLGNDWFEGGPKSLEQLNLEANDIEELGDRAFESLENVKQIWLGDNNFKQVSRSMFPNPAKKLWLLEMSFNGISELPEDMFYNMPVLSRVNVAGNKLKTISEDVFRQIWPQLEEVYFERNNEFVCDYKIKWIYEQKLPSIITGKCGGSNSLRGKNLEDLDEEAFE